MTCGTGDGVDVEVLGGFNSLDVAVEILLRSALDSVSAADDVGYGFGLDLAHAVFDAASVLDGELLVGTEVAHVQVTEFMGQGDEGHGSVVVAIESEFVV